MLLTIILLFSFATLHGKPTMGAFYYPWYGPNGHHWTPPGHILQPTLGEYSSLSIPVIDQHLQWANEYHIDFLMVSFWAAGGVTNSEIMLLFDRTDLVPTKIALLIEPDADLQAIKSQHYNSGGSYSNYVNNSVNWFIQRYDIIKNDHQWFSRSSYLHDPDGRKILGFFNWDSPAVTKDVISTVLAVRPDIGASTWIWYIGSLGNKVSTVRSLLYPNKGSWAPYQPMQSNGSYSQALNKYNQFEPGMSQKIMVACPSFNDTQLVGGSNTYIPRDSAYRFSQQLADIKVYAPNLNWLLITSFNEWNENSVIEPVVEYPGGPTEGTLYLGVLKSWWESW